MCLLVTSDTGQHPESAIVEQAILDNRDGWGVAEAIDGHIHYTLGFGLAKLQARIARIQGPYLLHFRWATHGSVGLRNCHPFKVNNQVAMAHNGILKIPIVDKRYSDSWHFARLYVRPYLQTWGMGALVADTERFISGGNKIAYLTSAGEVLIANRDCGEDREGCWYSNTHSFPENQYSQGQYVWDEVYWRDWQKKPAAWPKPVPMQVQYWQHPHRTQGVDESVEWDSVDEPEYGDPKVELESITVDTPADCDSCEAKTMTLYYDPETCMYVCFDCATLIATLIETETA